MTATNRTYTRTVDRPTMRVYRLDGDENFNHGGAYVFGLDATPRDGKGIAYDKGIEIKFGARWSLNEKLALTEQITQEFPNVWVG